MIGEKLFGVGIKISGKLDPSVVQSIRAAERQLKGLGPAAARGFNEAAQAGRKSFKNVLGNAAFQGSAAAAAGLTFAIGGSVKAAMEFESSMAEVRKVVDGLDTPEGLKQMRSEVLGLSRVLPISAQGIAEIVAAAGQSGIERSQLARFAEDAAKMAVAFDMTAAEAGESMAKLRSQFRIGQDEVVNLADAVNYLSNSTASTGRQITDFLLRVGAFGKQVALSEQQIAAFGAAMIDAGAEPEVAATSFRNLVRAMTKMDSASTRTAAAFASVLGGGGVDKLKAELKALEGVGGKGVAKLRKDLKVRISRAGEDVMTSLAEDMQKDAAGTIAMVFRALAKMPEARRISLASDMFGDEARAIAPLLKDVEALNEALDLVADPEKYKGSMLKEFEARSKTTANQLQLLRNNATALGIAIGDKLLPVLNKTFEALSPGIKWLTDITDRFPVATGVVLALTAAFVGLVALSPFIAATLSVITTTASVLAGLQLGATLAGSLGAVVPILQLIGGGLAFLAGPIGLVVLAIAGIVAAIVFAYQRVDWFRSMVDTILAQLRTAWDGFVQYLGGAWNMLVGLLTLDAERFGVGWSNVTAGARKVWQGVTAALGTAWGRVMGRMIEAARSTLGRLVGFFGQKIDELKQSLSDRFAQLGKSGGERVLNALLLVLRNSTIIGQIGNAVSGLMNRPQTPAATPPAPALPPRRRALGGQVFRGLDYLVGERQPEVFRPTMSGRILPSMEAVNRVTPTLGGLARIGRDDGRSRVAAPQASGRRGGAPLVVMQPGAISVTVGQGDPGTVERAVAAALEQFRYELESSYRSLLSD